MIENRAAPIGETTIRFFSFFTILTNLIVALYFTLISFQKKNKESAIRNNPGALTAITVYITIVGFVYQIILRHIWNPQGLQMVVDELLHTAIPIMVIIYWYLYINGSSVLYSQIPKWLLYPFVYLTYILLRGHFSNFYPYPFVDVAKLGIYKVLLNSILLVALFGCISASFIAIGRITKSK